MFSALLLGAAMCGNAQAFDWYADLAFASGGDKLAHVELVYDNGDTDSSKISAGGGISFAFGGAFELSESVQMLLAAGYKEDGVHASNGSVAFKRIPLDMALFYNGDHWRMGAGATYETQVSLAGVSGPSTQIHSSLGSILEIDYKFTDFFMLGLRYTRIQYEAEFNSWYTNNRVDINGNNSSLRVAFMF